ncbi:hypothetical protein [Zoogloea sp. 1C4]|uniref:hypothetical protein n=1 Tax=Zoogloea sp. 1C4 TaxID=2570190 RepID=UPI0012928F3E|nr:hypothetical protein [Zoogloea sp. 1C4]
MPRFRAISAALLAALALAGCEEPPSLLVPELQQQFRPGYPLADAIQSLKARNATLSVHNRSECESLARANTMSSRLRPGGGPCIFGKIPVSKNWLGGHTDVILQLVFNAEDKLADGDFEEIRVPFGWN